MLIRILALFVLVPLAELALLLQVGRWIGVAGTIALVAVTGILGAVLARRQGARAWRELQEELRGGRVPGRALLDGLLILIGAITLLTPGLLTDTLGFLLLLPPTRRYFARRLRDRVERAVQRGETGISVLMIR